MEYLLERWKPATAMNRFHGLQGFFKWLVDEGELRESPMARMKPPMVPETPPPVLSIDQLQKLIGVCSGRTSEALRDAAIIETPSLIRGVASARWLGFGFGTRMNRADVSRATSTLKNVTNSMCLVRADALNLWPSLTRLSSPCGDICEGETVIAARLNLGYGSRRREG